MKPIVAIVGRPNVGKSTFFNRVTRTQDALVDDFPGVTRDRHYGDAVWNDIAFTLVDTGGFTEGHEFADEIRFQVYQALEDADIIVLLLDGKEGISPFDRDIIKLLRVTARPVFFAVNKIDGAERESHVSEFFSLGIEPLYPISAEHRYGMADFLDALVDAIVSIVKPSELQTAEGTIGIAVVGRPNAGKSSLINRILGQERLLVSDQPGTTRDAIDTICQVDGKSYLLIDTAGIRRKGKVTRKIEKFSIIKALRSLDRCDVALIVMDAAEGIAYLVGELSDHGAADLQLGQQRVLPADPQPMTGVAEFGDQNHIVVRSGDQAQGAVDGGGRRTGARDLQAQLPPRDPLAGGDRPLEQRPQRGQAGHTLIDDPSGELQPAGTEQLLRGRIQISDSETPVQQQKACGEIVGDFCWQGARGGFGHLSVGGQPRGLGRGLGSGVGRGGPPCGFCTDVC